MTVSIAFIIWPIKLCDLLMTVPVTELRFSFAEGGIGREAWAGLEGAAGVA